MEVYGKSDIGSVRSSNQDDIKFEKVNDDIIWAVICDGMGGAKGGDIASSLASTEISKIFNEFSQRDLLPGETFKSTLESAMSNAGKLIYNTSMKDETLTGMGTTAVAVYVKNKVAHIAHVGDSRAYIINSSGIKRITRDHSIVQEMLNNGKITPEEAEIHPRKNIITRALGVKGVAIPDYNEYNLAEGDAILLCTDGLTNELKDEEIYNIFVSSKAEEVPNKLINEANNRRGSDNITVAIIA